jgi:hypothetical protein
LEIRKRTVNPSSSEEDFNAADRWNSHHMWLGAPAVILHTLASTAFFNDIPLIPKRTF